MILKVKTLTGKIFEVDVSGKNTIQEVKEKLNQIQKVDVSLQKIIFNGKILSNDDEILDNYGVQENDFMVLLVKRVAKEKMEVDTAAPSIETILEKTKTGEENQKILEADDKNISGLIPQLSDLMDMLSSFSPARAGGAPALERGSGAVPPIPEVDPESLQNLQDMGFTQERATKALLLNRMNTEAAMNWLLEHEGDPEADNPLTADELLSIAEQEANFQADPNSVARLQEMGFAEDEINTALRETNNNHEEAAAWLLGDRDVAGGPERMLLQSIVANPLIQRGLTNPRVLQAFHTMMQNPATAEQYLADEEIGPVLLQVNNILRATGSDSDEELEEYYSDSEL